MIAYDSTDDQLQAYIGGTWLELSAAGMIDISDDTNLTAGTGNGIAARQQILSIDHTAIRSRCRISMC
ncbi:MAG: hypothetical protein H6756_10140 [Candidatus Omnitrophica bacterium]|nr:hypothetical protein [Candidatus Omnitrophota bacterium]